MSPRRKGASSKEPSFLGMGWNGPEDDMMFNIV